MTSEARARRPRLVENVNGTNTFTFDMYDRFIDIQTGEEVENPYIKLLVNERKLKVFWKNKWYDFLIKGIEEDSVAHSYSYTCEDTFITELGKTGFDLEFTTDLQNNIDTAENLTEKTIEGTDWIFDSGNSDVLEETAEEYVYQVQVPQDVSFNATREHLQSRPPRKSARWAVFYKVKMEF